MRLYAVLTFTLLALQARAATIPENGASEINKDTTQENSEPLKNIPVEVIAEDVIPLVKNEDSTNEVVPETEDEFKKVGIDLSDLGPPQHQEHETQNPEGFNEEKISEASIRQSIIQTQQAFNEGLQGISKGLQNLLSNDEQIASVHGSIKNLQDNFSKHIQMLNATLHSYWIPSIPAVRTSPVDDRAEIEEFEEKLEKIENKFEGGIKNLAEEVDTIASLKAETDNNQGEVNPTNPVNPAPANPEPANPGFQNPFQVFVQYLQNFQQQMQNSFNNMSTQIQTYLGQNQQNNQNTGTTNGQGGLFQNVGQGIQNILNPQNANQVPVAGNTQTPTVNGQPQAPGFFQGIQSSIQNFLRPGQQGQQPQVVQQQTNTLQQQSIQQAPPLPNQNLTPTPQSAQPVRPIAQVIQGLPFVQGFVNLIQPNKPQIIPQNPISADKPLVGTNAVPVIQNPVNNIVSNGITNLNKESAASEPKPAVDKPEELVPAKVEMPVEEKKPEPEVMPEKTERS